MNICNYNECTGCYACANICPKSCITLQDDCYGEIHPIIDEAICVDCGACKKVCPNNKVQNFSYPKICYAAWMDDASYIRECATGGIGTLLSEFMISNRNGIVYGTAYGENFEPRVLRIVEKNDLQKLKGSKYAQSKVYDAYNLIKLDLRSNKQVLFIGTPCQIAGLLAYLKIDYSNLITVDLLCHGVAPTSYFLEELGELKKKYVSFDNIRFRGNDGNNYKLTLWKNGKCLYKEDCNKQYYFWGFIKSTTLRENCFICKYARPDRISDITIGDYIGLGSKYRFVGDPNNKSFVSCNTERGVAFFREVTKQEHKVVIIERDYSERLIYAPSLLEPAVKPNDYVIFRKMIKGVGYIKTTRYMFRSEIRMNRVKDTIAKLKRYCLRPVRKLRNWMN